MPQGAKTTATESEGEQVPTQEPAQKSQEDKRQELLANAEKQLLRISAGTVTLETPIRAGGKDLTELDYDLRKLTGWEYADALDTDKGAHDPMKISAKQALALFAAAAAKATKGLDAKDIMERIGPMDASIGIRIASVFFMASVNLGNKRISNG
ncbi:MAG: hypothetical protein LLF96_01275 [Eubacteriales bacterium]|nr:hypothetical protein [Eubacteriales bacterium]